MELGGVSAYAHDPVDIGRESTCDSPNSLMVWLRLQ